MITPTWDTIELPLLEEVARAEQEGREPILKDFFDRQDIDWSSRGVAILRRLWTAGYLTANFGRGGQIADVRLAPHGARAVGLWPCDDPVRALIEAIEETTALAESNEERTLLERIRDALSALPQGVAVGLATEYAKRLAGLS